ncbi:hypothetical protein [uncultured Dokdonia sp.]|uniref:hypothetical protein n=1 Tax=uncultured Dokdonia sp. TaxID=575653 RepID=UPI00260E4430|nr:hypothetical protein [uncultured Dokdonia sp.]
MKKIFFLLVITPLTLQAQSLDICQANTIEYGLQSYHTGDVVMDFQNEEPLVINTYFLIMESTAINENISESDYLAAVAYLNINYNHFNIFFKYLGFEFVDDIFDYDTSYYTDRINFRILPEEGGAVAGFPYDLNVLTTFQALTNDENKEFLIAHETGHILGLIHTNGTTGNTNGTFNTPLNCNGNQITMGTFPIINPTSENVTRDETDINYNATTAGDYVVDTPATYYQINLCVDNSEIHYLYSNEVLDVTNTPYENIDTRNFMISDDRVEYHEFKTRFTDGQGIRMRETIENEAVLQAILAPVSCLYEPYSGDYYVAGPTTQNDTPLFQPGFDYKFVSAGGQAPNGYQVYNTPSSYENTSFVYDAGTILNEVDRYSLDLEKIYHPNKSAIIIEQLDDQPRRCYHNINRAVSSGTVIKFTDNILNHNYTITPKDSVGINLPTLIQDLENGLYLIEKNYNDGTQEQEVILKGDQND